MAKLENYNGSIDLISGLRPKNDGDFPLMQAHDIVVDENGTRLDEKLESLSSAISTAGSAIIVTTAEEMNTILTNATSADNGKIYYYVGETTADYVQNSYYKIDEIGE